MPSTRIARRASRTVVAAVAVALAVAVPASATTIQTSLRPDLVVSAPLDTHTYSGNPSVNSYFVGVANNGITAAAASQVKVTFQPVTRIVFNGQTSWVNMPGAAPIAGTGTAASLSGGGSESVGIQLSTAPAGYNRVTACADSTNIVSESNESNNCTTAIIDMQPIFFG